MASYNPPNEYITKFNTKLFNQPEDTLSQAEANNLYLSKTVADTSTSPLTTFNGQVAFNNFAPISNTLPSIATHLVTKYYTDFYFLTISTAAATYQTIAGMSAYLTTASASATYQTIAGMSAYLTTASAASIYQTIAGMSSYLTTASAASIYQTIAGMSAYLTTASAASIYQTIAGMSAYQLISNMVNYVDLTTAQTITGLKLFTNNLEVFNSAGANLILRVSSTTSQQSTLKQNASALQIINNSTTPSIIFTISTVPSLTVSPTQFLLDSTCFLTTNDIKSRLSTGSHSLLSDITTGSLTISSATSTNTLNGTNTINGTTTFSVIPLCSVNAISSNQLVNYTTLTGQGFTTLPIIQANANVWTNTNTFNNGAVFNTVIPTTSISATSANQLVNYTTLNAQGFTTLPIIQANANVWTNTNTFNDTIFARDDIRCRDVLSPYTNEQQIYMDVNTFTFLPLFNLNIYRFVTKSSVGVQKDALEITNSTITALSNFIFNDSTTFNNGAVFNTVIPTTTISATSANQLVNYTTLNAQGFTTLPLVQGNNNVWTGTNTFNTFLPTSTITASLPNQLVNYTTLTGQGFTTLALVQSNNNTFTANTSFNGEVSCNTWVNLLFRTRIYDILGSGNYTQMYMIGTNDFVITPIQNSGKINFYCKDGVGVQTNTFSSASVANTSNSPFISNGLATFNNGAIFNTVIPTTSITATTANQIVNYTTLTSQSFTTLALVQSNNSTYTGTNIFSQDITVKSSVYLNSISGGKQATFYLDTYGTVLISSDNVSGTIQLNTEDYLGNTYNRIIINENEINTTVPLSLTIDYTYYNPVNFTSNRLGYSTSNTGSTNTLTTATGNNSGQLDLPCGSWNITYTAIITVITGTLTSLESLEVFIADSSNADLNIIGLDVLNYYKITTISLGKQIKISASGNIISYNNGNTQYNLRVIPIFVAGAGGLSFTGKISATRNA